MDLDIYGRLFGKYEWDQIDLDICSHLFGKYEWDLGSGEWKKKSSNTVC